MTLILGINAYHGDAAACVIKDGALVAAAEEERFRRQKHWAGFPSQAIAWCLEEAGTDVQSIDAIAINQDAKANLIRKIAFVMGNRPDFAMLMDRLRNKRERSTIGATLAHEFKGRV